MALRTDATIGQFYDRLKAMAKLHPGAGRHALDENADARMFLKNGFGE